MPYNVSIVVYFIFMSLIVFYFLHSTSILSFYIDVVLTLSNGPEQPQSYTFDLLLQRHKAFTELPLSWGEWYHIYIKKQCDALKTHVTTVTTSISVDSTQRENKTTRLTYKGDKYCPEAGKDACYSPGRKAEIQIPAVEVSLIKY